MFRKSITFLAKMRYVCYSMHTLFILNGACSGFVARKLIVFLIMSDEKQEKKGQFAELLKGFFSKVPKKGALIEGTVVSVDNGDVRIDVSGFITGVVRGPELFAESKEYGNIKVGDIVQATVLEQENESGEMELSFRVAGQQLVWDRMQKWSKDRISVVAKVLAANKGGLLMQVDALTGFMPVSQLSPDNYPRVPGGDKNKILEHLRSFIGREFQVKVIDVNQENDKLIVSEKAVWEDDQKAVLDSYSIGDIIEGEVSALTSFGAFVKFGEGLEGLVHISEIVWQRIDHPRDILKVGQEVKAQIIDLNKSKIYLSMKRLIDDPWKSVKDKYKIDQVVSGEVHKIESFGLMIKLDDQIHGLAHISELSDKQINEQEMRDKFEVGKYYDFDVMNIEPAEHRLGLKLAGVKTKKIVEPEKTEEKKSTDVEVKDDKQEVSEAPVEENKE